MAIPTNANFSEIITHRKTNCSHRISQKETVSSQVWAFFIDKTCLWQLKPKLKSPLAYFTIVSKEWLYIGAYFSKGPFHNVLNRWKPNHGWILSNYLAPRVTNTTAFYMSLQFAKHSNKSQTLALVVTTAFDCHFFWCAPNKCVV